MMKDRFGREILLGDKVIYVTRRGSHLDIKAGTVEELRSKQHPYSNKVKRVVYIGGVNGPYYKYKARIIKLDNIVVQERADGSALPSVTSNFS